MLPFEKYSIAFLLITFFACKKDVNHSPASVDKDNFKLTRISPLPTSATVGESVSVSFRFLNNNDTVSAGFLYLYNSDCEGLSQKIIDIGKNSVSGTSITYSWLLNQYVGVQTLKAVLCDSLKNPRDSAVISIPVDAITGSGWFRSGCLNPDFHIFNVSRSSAGRIFLTSTGYGPKYSDDEGKTWMTVNGLNNQLTCYDIVTLATNEIFISSAREGINYSSDGGNTWTSRNNGLELNDVPMYVQSTKSGVLFSEGNTKVFKSDDKGVSWHELKITNYPFVFKQVSSLSDGSLVALQNGLILSTDEGENWTSVSTAGNLENADFLFVDENDDIYIAFSTPDVPYALYKSSDKMLTWTELYTPTFTGNPQAGFSRVQRHGDSLYMITNFLPGLVVTKDFSTYHAVSDLPGYGNYNNFLFKNDELSLIFEQGVYYHSN